jgi:hypothetical protein
MKIVRLNAENVKRIKAVEITPDGAVQIVAGRNAQGKSSVLDSIWMALEWKASGKATPRPIRDGEDKASVRLDLGDIVVTRKWSGDKTTLLVEAADGAVYQRPQEMLDALVGSLSFDPLAFTQQGAREQVQTLLGLVSLPFDPAALEAERAGLYDQRRTVGQEAARAKGAFESLSKPPADASTVEVSSASIIAEYDAAQASIRNRDDLARALYSAESEHASADAALAAAQRRFDDAKTAWDKAKKDAAALGDAPDLAEIRERLAAVEDANAAARTAAIEQRTYTERHVAYERVNAEYAALTVRIDALDKQKADGLAAATFPIEGLSFGEGGVTYNGVPFCQSSSGEQLKVSLALAMAMNPTLRVIRITDGSLLDSENMALIQKMATDADFQIWIERVDESGTAGVVIEDGQVRA